jgi:hypothetical protein
MFDISVRAPENYTCELENGECYELWRTDLSEKMQGHIIVYG